MHSETPYYNYKNFMRTRYGDALYRVPVDLGYGCPNRGENSRGGCSFCAEDGGRAQQIAGVIGLADQVAAGVSFARKRYGAKKFMLYIQAYTGTFADIDLFKRQIHELLEYQSFCAISIGTRPDCLPRPVIDFFKELNRSIELWVELGIQSTHDKTLELVNRGHDWRCSREAVIQLAEIGVKVVPHLILGLPGEGLPEWCQSAERIAALPIAAVKVHNLHVIKGSALADEYVKVPFSPLNEHQYVEGVIEVIRRMPPDIPIIRVTTDTPADQLIAPKWSMTKGEFTKLLAERMGYQGVVQGDLYPKIEGGEIKEEPLHFDPLPTDDGSITFWNSSFKEHYHTRHGAAAEAVAKFVVPAKIEARVLQGDLRLLDICFGLGYNSLAACEVAEQFPSSKLKITAIEIDINVIKAAATAISTPPGGALDWTEIINSLASCGSWSAKSCSIQLLHGDARDKLVVAAEDGPFDVVFLDAFSTQRNAELWTLDFFKRIRAAMGTTGVLLTYSAALPVRSGLMEAGFFVGETAPVGRIRGGTIAAVCADDIELPLPAEELGLIRNTVRGLPYRDPDQLWSSRQILRERELERRVMGEQ